MTTARNFIEELETLVTALGATRYFDTFDGGLAVLDVLAPDGRFFTHTDDRHILCVGIKQGTRAALAEQMVKLLEGATTSPCANPECRICKGDEDMQFDTIIKGQWASTKEGCY